ncbi:MAG: hypothetical protein AAGC55_03275, partial [Myxococcota bacterium]
LMEKVRKAEVPPPSKFNRRVNEELDRITLRALARDVDNRYQSAAELGADLGRVLAGYRFDPKELRQFMRQLFRKEYAREQTDAATALKSQPHGTGRREDGDGERGRAGSGADGATPVPAEPSGVPAQPRRRTGERPISGSQPVVRPDSQPPAMVTPAPVADTDQAADGSQDRPKGFWARLRRRKR